VLGLALMLITLGVGEPSTDLSSVRCDDGARLLNTDGVPNWDCEIRGCSPTSKLCHQKRENLLGEESEHLFRSVQTCNGWWSCLKLWAGCDGTYECNEPSGLGCGKGTCTPVPLSSATSDSCSENTENREYYGGDTR